MRRDGTEAQVPGEGDQERRNPNAGKFLSSLIQSVSGDSFASSDRSEQLTTLQSDYCNNIISSYYFLHSNITHWSYATVFDQSTTRQAAT